MSSTAGSYQLIRDYTLDSSGEEISVSPFWVLAVVRLGTPLSFSRSSMKSVPIPLENGAKVRTGTLIITGDCQQLTISNSKTSHTKTLTAQLLQSGVNYLTEILPGDWVAAWIVNDENTAQELIERIKSANPDKPCNEFRFGFKFLGRVQNIRKQLQINPANGLKTSRYQLQATGFKELDTQFFYDFNLATGDTEKSLGEWLARIGTDAQELFGFSLEKGQRNNVNDIIPILIDLIIGRGISHNVNPTGEMALAAAPGALATSEAPFAYLVPGVISSMLGYDASEITKPRNASSYADILTLIQGVQSYSDGQNATDYRLFLPNKAKDSTPRRIKSGIEMLGSFIPIMPELTNKPIWEVLQQYLNPHINEMYTCLRVNEEGLVVPTIVLRQIPLTTEAYLLSLNEKKHQAREEARQKFREIKSLSNEFNPAEQAAVDRQFTFEERFAVATAGDLELEDKALDAVFPEKPLTVTPFLTLPRWVMHPAMVFGADIGRSDSSHFNFIHVYGQDSYSSKNMSMTDMIVENPPIRDDLDICRSGVRAYMATVACAVNDQVAKAPTEWMALIADWSIGSQFAYNGTITSVGIHSPICEGDNLQWENVIYHIMSVTHSCSIDPGSGTKSFRTTMSLYNGMRVDGMTDNNSQAPIYPGFLPGDERASDPGISREGGLTEVADLKAGENK